MLEFPRGSETRVGEVARNRKESSRNFGALRECQVFCVWLIGSMLSERSKDDDDFKRTAGRVAEGLQAA